MSDAAKINDLLSSDKLSIDLAKKIIAEQQNQTAALNRQVREQQTLIDELRAIIDQLRGKHPTQRLDEAYSIATHEKRKTQEQRAKTRKKKKADRKKKRRNSNAHA